MTNADLIETLDEETIKAEDPSSEFRSIWTDLRGVSFTQGWLDVKGIKVRYLRAGTPGAPTMLLLHGTAGHAETYAPTLGAFSKHFDCWAFDAPGCGYSDMPEGDYDAYFQAAFIRDFAETIGATSLDITGCSVGSWAALRCALEYPDLVRRILMISPAGGPLPEPDDLWYEIWMNQIDLPEMEVRLENAGNPSWDRSEAILRGLFNESRPVPDDLIASRMDVNLQPGAAEVVDKVNWWTNTELRIKNSFTRDELRSIKQPVLGVCEVDDMMLILSQAMFTCLPNSKLLRMDGVGHWPHYEAPGQFNRIALEFFGAGDDAHEVTA